MGYSIATPIRSEKAKRSMMAFLAGHFDPDFNVEARGPLDRDLSYDHGPCRIGFDATLTSDWTISMCAWIALKVGKRKVFPTKANPKAAGPCKYLRYDGVEDWPLLITQRRRKTNGAYVQVNEVGCLVPARHRWEDAWWKLSKRSEKLQKIEEELKRLDAAWKKWCRQEREEAVPFRVPRPRS